MTEAVIWKHYHTTSLICVVVGMQKQFRYKGSIDLLGLILVLMVVFHFVRGMTESMEHVFIQCVETQKIWVCMLQWLQIRHVRVGWNEELQWICARTRSKRCHATSSAKIAIA